MQVKGNKDEKFVEERRALLERFLREIAHYDYLVESKEFKIFARGTGEVTDELNKLPPQAPIQILEKYRLNFKIDEDQPAAEIARYKDKINIFQAFLKKAIVSLEKQKKEFKEYATAQDDSYNHYERIYAAFIKFEETAVDYYGDGDRNLRVMTHPSANDLVNSIDETIKSWKNPFREAWIWIKGELLDVRGMMDAMNGRD
jgi:sorting nexin-1/2